MYSDGCIKNERLYVQLFTHLTRSVSTQNRLVFQDDAFIRLA